MTEDEAIKVLAEEYRRAGYAVDVEPSAGLAQFLEISDVDLIATKQDEILAIRLKRYGPYKDQPVIVAEGRIGVDYSLSLLKEAERLQTPETRRAALLMAWTAFEAAAREVLRGEGQEIEKRGTPKLINHLLELGKISQEDVERLREGMYLRNVIIHGMETREISPDVITFLLETVRKLKFRRLADQLHLRDRVSVTVMRNNLNKDPAFRRAIEDATRLLDEVLGQSRGLVSAEWDQGEDGQGRTVVTLKLSDFTGSVTGSFSPDEIEKTHNLRTRLYRLWGDLLQIRNSKQLESITGTKEGV